MRVEALRPVKKGYWPGQYGLWVYLLLSFYLRMVKISLIYAISYFILFLPIILTFTPIKLWIEYSSFLGKREFRISENYQENQRT